MIKVLFGEMEIPFLMHASPVVAQTSFGKIPSEANKAKVESGFPR